MAGRHEKYQRLPHFCKTLPPTAVAHPCDDSSLEGAVSAANMGLIAPILVGPGARSSATSISPGSRSRRPRIATKRRCAVELVRAGKAEAEARPADASKTVS
jgi:phosphate acetyltransferase